MSDSYRGVHKARRLAQVRAARAGKQESNLAEIRATARRTVGIPRATQHNADLAARAAKARAAAVALIRPDIDSIRARRLAGAQWREIAGGEYGLSATALERAYKTARGEG